MKRHNLIFCVLVAIIFLAAGCEKGGEIRITNRTSYPLHITLYDEEYTLPTQQTRVFEIDNETQTPFSGEIRKNVKLGLIGETYQIFDDYELTWIDSTYVQVKAGETTTIFVDPNRAGLKVINQSDFKINRILAYRVYPLNTQITIYDVAIAPGGTWFRPVEYATPSNMFYNVVLVILEDETSLQYGSPQTVLEVDEQFVITVQNPVP